MAVPGCGSGTATSGVILALITEAVPQAVSMGVVTLTVHDADRVAAFYERVIGLHRMPSGGGPVRLGAGGQVLLELQADKAARQALPRDAGLFHTALLLPDRPTLAAWLRRVVAIDHPLRGVSDHAVSEAIYLADPEGNGVEIYADRPRSGWRWSGGEVHMPTNPLDVADFLAQDDGRPWQGLVSAAIGHVHLRVGNIPEAERFYAGVLGLGITSRYPGSTSYAAGGYHHHLATNVWDSHGAPARREPMTGLAAVELLMPAEAIQATATRAADAVGQEDGRLVLRDPWNILLVLTPHHGRLGVLP